MTHSPSDPANAARVQRDIAVALSLMRMALALLDRSDHSFAAPRLSHAIDTLLATKEG